MPCHDTIRQVSTRYLYVILAGYHRPHWHVCCAVLLPVNVGRRTCGCIVSKEKKELAVVVVHHVTEIQANLYLV